MGGAPTRDVEPEGLMWLLHQRREQPIWWRLWRRFGSGTADWRMFSKEELFERLGWTEDNVDPERDALRLEAIRLELDVTIDALRDQFAKIASLIALMGFVIAFGLSGHNLSNRATIVAVVVAAGLAVWAQMPRFKVFSFHKRRDAGLRCGLISNRRDLFWYYYQWLGRREHTLNNVELMLVGASFATFVALGFVIFAA